MKICRSLLAISLITILVACASGGSGDGPQVEISQTSAVDVVDAAAGTAVPVQFRVDVTNPFDHPLTLLGIEIETVGVAGGYSMKRVRHQFNDVIAARSRRSFDLRAWVEPLQVTNEGKVVTSVMLRGVARFDADGKVIRSAFASRAKQ